jgi:hypothetical protein
MKWVTLFIFCSSLYASEIVWEHTDAKITFPNDSVFIHEPLVVNIETELQIKGLEENKHFKILSITDKIYELEPQDLGNHYINIVLYNEEKTVVPDLFRILVTLPDEAKDLSALRPEILPLDNRLKVEINQENKELFLKNQNNKNLSKINTEKPWGWLLLLFSILIALWMVPKIKHRKKKIAELDPRKKALQALKKLASENISSIDLFYVRLTSITRTYIEEQFHIKAPERTTQEFLKELSENNCFDNTTKKLLQQLLQDADMVKFARKKPTEEEKQQSLYSAKKFINSVFTTD